MDLLDIIMVAGFLIVLPSVWWLTSKTYSEKGLFGFHACRWLNSTCLKNGVIIDGVNCDGKPHRLCKEHFEETQHIRKLVDRQYKGEITQDEFWEQRKSKQ